MAPVIGDASVGKGQGGFAEPTTIRAGVPSLSRIDFARQNVTLSGFVANLIVLSPFFSYILFGKRKNFQTKSGICTPESMFGVRFTPRKTATNNQHQWNMGQPRR